MPDPRILRMLGQIELKGWQCIAEFIDNSIDAMLKSEQTEHTNEIHVYIPSRGELNRNEPLIVRDNGLGMNPEELENCLKAGYTSKDADNLGLFGMGFNIASARLGDVVEVWSSKKEMNQDIGVKIDLLEMQRTKSFVRELMTRPKSLFPSGTSIEISKFHPRAQQLLNRTHIQKELNRTYSKAIIDDYDISIKINEQLIKPFNFCVWDEDRSVDYKGEKIPAIMPIYKELGKKEFCKRCYVWIDEYENDVSEVSVCPTCNQSDMITTRKIEIRGWVGIQRYNDLYDFGLNIIRNGRIIKKQDKSFFTWQDRYEKNNGESIFEYPIDTPGQGGRIVGEIVADFIIPAYTKDSFEETDKLWLDAVEAIRGKQPFQPEIAKKLGFPKNQSPLGKLFYGYRKAFPPGKKNLIPGNSKGEGIYTLARDWGQRFYNGEAEYQTDEKWWEAVLEAEAIDEEIDSDDPTDPKRKRKQQKNTGQKSVDEVGNLFPGIAKLIYPRQYDLTSLIDEIPINVAIMNYWPEIEFSAPIIFHGIQASKFDVYINNHHPLFKDFADGWEDLVLMEVATKFYERMNDVQNWPVSRLYYELKKKYASETMLNIQALVANAKGLMTEIQNFLVNENVKLKLDPLPTLEPNEILLLKKNYLQVESKNLSSIDNIISTPEFLRYMDLNYLFNFIKHYPHLIFDDKFFSLPFDEMEEDEIRVRQLDQYLGYFSDVKWFIYELSNFPDALVKQQKNMIIRNRFSLLYLNGKRV
jgi:hypothetical protein